MAAEPRDELLFKVRGLINDLINHGGNRIKPPFYYSITPKKELLSRETLGINTYFYLFGVFCTVQRFYKSGHGLGESILDKAFQGHLAAVNPEDGPGRSLGRGISEKTLTDKGGNRLAVVKVKDFEAADIKGGGHGNNPLHLIAQMLLVITHHLDLGDAHGGFKTLADNYINIGKILVYQGGEGLTGVFGHHNHLIRGHKEDRIGSGLFVLVGIRSRGVKTDAMLFTGLDDRHPVAVFFEMGDHLAGQGSLAAVVPADKGNNFRHFVY